jgi:hypothetical protein
VNPIFSDETLLRTERQIDGRKHKYSQTKAGALVVVVVVVPEVVARNARDLDVGVGVGAQEQVEQVVELPRARERHR